MKTSVLLGLIALLLIPNQGLSQNEWRRGYYYDAEGEKIEGIISLRNYNLLHYRKTKNSKRKKLKPTDVKAYVVGTDSFTVKKNYWVKYGLSGYSVKKGFVEVLETGKINIYWHYAYNNYDVITTKLVEKDDIMKSITSQKDFKKIIPEIIADAPDLIKKIESKEYEIYNLEEVIRKYNERFIE